MGLYKRGNGRWYLDEVVNGKRLQGSLRTTDKRKAEKRASDLRNELTKNEVLVRFGVATFDATAGRAPKDLVEEYVEELRRRGRSDDHVEPTRARLLYLFEGLSSLSEATTERLCAALARVAEERELTPRTVNFYRAAAHAFFKWLVTADPPRWPRNPVVSVKAVRVAGNARDRRALELVELVRLLETAPPDRSLIYRLAATSGIRRSELEGLKRSDFDLKAGTVTVRAKVAKNKKTTPPLPLPEGTLEALAPVLKGLEADALVFPRVPRIETFYEETLPRLIVRVLVERMNKRGTPACRDHRDFFVRALFWPHPGKWWENELALEELDRIERTILEHMHDELDGGDAKPATRAAAVAGA
jgi:integrase